MFYKKTVIKINNFLEQKSLKKIKKVLPILKFKTVYQKRAKHFNHVFKFNDSKWPSKNEEWSSRFGVAINSELKKELVDDIFYNHIVKEIKKRSKNKIKYFLYPNIYKIKSGDYFRCHYDQFAGTIGYTLFFSTDWKWDYGGILNFLDKNLKSEAFFPENNMLLLRNEKKPLLHYVTQVPKYVNTSHYLILGWAKDKPGKKSKFRGEYLKL